MTIDYRHSISDFRAAAAADAAAELARPHSIIVRAASGRIFTARLPGHIAFQTFPRGAGNTAPLNLERFEVQASDLTLEEIEAELKELLRLQKAEDKENKALEQKVKRASQLQQALEDLKAKRLERDMNDDYVTKTLKEVQDMIDQLESGTFSAAPGAPTNTRAATGTRAAITVEQLQSYASAHNCTVLDAYEAIHAERARNAEFAALPARQKVDMATPSFANMGTGSADARPAWLKPIDPAEVHQFAADNRMGHTEALAELVRRQKLSGAPK